MLEFDLDYFRRIKIWFDSNQDLVLLNENREIKKYYSHPGSTFLHTTIIIELFIPRGGRNIYGLLGADYIPVQSSILEISIPGGEYSNSRIYEDSLLKKNEEIRLHFSSERRDLIFNKIESINKKTPFCGKLNFRYGASAEVSSNEWIFSMLVNLLVELFKTKKEDITIDLLNEIIKMN